LHGDIFRKHPGHCRDLELPLHVGANPAAGQSVPARVEGRPGNDDIGLEFPDQAQYLGGRLFHAVGKQPVSTDDRAHNLRILAQYLLQEPPRADHFGLRLGPRIGLLLSADSPEKLVHIMDDSHAQYSWAR
jgi:hypothetical protein